MALFEDRQPQISYPILLHIAHIWEYPPPGTRLGRKLNRSRKSRPLAREKVRSHANVGTQTRLKIIEEYYNLPLSSNASVN